MTDRIPVGVIGVGTMGQNHARVYRELPSAELVGVTDTNDDCAAEVAASYDTRPMQKNAILDAVEAVSIAVPTECHYAVAQEAIERDVHVLVEKPFVKRIPRGWDLVKQADERDLTLQVGHIERFNPAVQALNEIVSDFTIIAIDANRLGPPIDRDVDVSPVFDLMIHDIDIVRSLAGGDVTSITAVSTPNAPYTSASLSFDSIVATLTASRITQNKVRQLTVTARECWVKIDYIDQSIEIYHHSVPKYVEREGGIKFRDNHIVERPTVDNSEPLKAELQSFLDAVLSGKDPFVSGIDGIESLKIANKVNEAIGERKRSLEVDT